MKPFAGYEAKKIARRESLPKGGYVVQVLNTEEISYTWGKVLEISFDVVEGQYKGFFREDYKANPNEDKKWRGKYRLAEPKDDGSEKDGWTKNTFNGVMYAFESSNPGFRWDWDETKLKGLIVGALYRNREWEKDGNTGWTTECGYLINADDVRNQRFEIPKDKLLPKKKEQPAAAFEEISDDDDLPF